MLKAKYTEASQKPLNLLKDLKSAEEEIDSLKAYIIDLKARVNIYLPFQDDPVDHRLAEYINSQPD